MSNSAPSCPANGGLTFRRCKIHFMLRAAVLLPFLRGIRRFSIPAHAGTLDACYMTSWQLSRSDLHRQVDDDFSGHTILLLCAIIKRPNILFKIDRNPWNEGIHVGIFISILLIFFKNICKSSDANKALIFIATNLSINRFIIFL